MGESGRVLPGKVVEREHPKTIILFHINHEPYFVGFMVAYRKEFNTKVHFHDLYTNFVERIISLSSPSAMRTAIELYIFDYFRE